MPDKIRCEWSGSNLLMIEYHDLEWGKPTYEDQLLFEFLCLEGAQAGLSWQTILNKRKNFKKLFDSFDPTKIMCYNDVKIEQLMQDKGIIRNRKKIEAFIINARIFMDLKTEYGTFEKFIWQFVNHKPINNFWEKSSEIPAKTNESEIMSKALKKLGFKFVGPVICYAFMQATGMVNDHLTSCYRYKEVQE